ncbi:MAG: hypothetical protein JOZ40_15375 [Methylobacteriaceae bacterium]|nr:hypothetical protein [Methylobacteriaceae bacterium]
MSGFARLVLLSLVLCGWTAAAGATPGFVTGDSLGVGVSWASKLRSVAKNSVSIRAMATPIEQISQAEPGTWVFLSLGTNDAVGDINGLTANIDKIVAAADNAKVTLVWMGPPCVFKPWDKNAIALDGILKEKLQGTSVIYVSMEQKDDPLLCDRAVRAPDGVHFTMSGYNHMWSLARDAAAAKGFIAEVASAAPEGPPKATATHKAKKKKKRKSRKKAPAAGTPAAPSEAAPPSGAAPQPSPPPQ